MPETDLHEDLALLRREVQILNSHRFVRMHNSWSRLLLFNFLRGLALGLGSVIGATVLVSILVYVLSQINFIPIIGDYAAQILDLLNEGE